MTVLQNTSTQPTVARQTVKKQQSLTLRTLNKDTTKQKGTVILADISGSMRGEKIQNLRKALKKVWRPGIEGIAFCTGMYELREEDISSLDTSGCTAMLAPLQEAWSRSPSHIILLTDGEPDEDKSTILKEVRWHTGIPIDTVGMADSSGSYYDPEFLAEIALLTGGRFTDVGEPVQLTDTLQYLLDYKPAGLQAPKEGGAVEL